MFLSLQKYDINLVYKTGKELVIADGLSRANLNIKYQNELDLEDQVCLISDNLNISDARLTQLTRLTNEDPVLSILRNYIRKGWPNSIKKIPHNVKPYYKFKVEITEGNNLIYKGQKVIIPAKMRRLILEKIHVGHFSVKNVLQGLINQCIGQT